MTLPQFQELAAYWRNYPPTHLLLRAMSGFKPQQEKSTNLADLFTVFGQHP